MKTSTRGAGVPKRRSYLHPLLILGLFGLLTGLLYVNALENEFVQWDDATYVTENPFIRELSPHQVYRIFSSILASNYTPLTILSYAVDYHFWKLDPRGYHITNLLLYLIDAILVYFVASRMLQRPPFALLSSLIFLTHPLHVESVTWVSARKDVLSLAFFLISFLLFARYLEQNPAKGERREAQGRGSPRLTYVGALWGMVGALLSKATTLTLPFVFVLYDLCKGGFETRPGKSGRQEVSSKLQIYIPFFLMSGLLTYLHIKVSQISGVLQEYHGGSFYSTLLVIPKVLCLYIQLFFSPVHLSAWYEISIPSSILDPSALFPSLGLVGILGLMIWAYTLSRRVFFAISWFFITLLPVSNLLPTSTLLADRYMFIPSLGLSLLSGIALENLYHLRSRLFSADFVRTVTVTGSIFLLLFYSVLTVERNTVWSNDYTLWSDTVQKSPDSYLPHHNLAAAYFKAGQVDAAIAEYETALKIKPDALGTRYNLGIAYAEKNLLDRAEAKFQEVLSLSPWHAEAHYSLGLIYDRQGRWDEAMKSYQKALEFKPDFAEAHNNLGSLYYLTGSFNKAIEEFHRALELKPDHVKALNNLKIAYSRIGASNTPTDPSGATLKP